MGKIQIEFGWNNQEEDLQKLLAENKLTHLKSHKENYLKVGDALKSDKGVIVRVVEKFNNYENLSHDFVLANKNVSSEELEKQFLCSTWYPTSNIQDDLDEADFWDGDDSYCE